ncbi:MAG: T9SS type A sorting domain-containing protein, partial [Bacteroidota bacterium]
DGDDVSFILQGSYDHGKPLVLECAKSLSCPAGTSPIANLAYSMYMGGSGNDVMNATASFQTNNIYVTGASMSSTLPFVTGTNLNTNVFEAFVFNMDAITSEVYWGTFYGGVGNDIAADIDIDNDNNLYIVGTTSSNNLPQNTNTGLVSINPSHLPGYWGGELHGVGTTDLFIVKVDGSNSGSGGSPLWADYVGSTENDVSPAISINNYGPFPASDIYMSGNTFGSDFPMFSTCSGSGYNQPWNHSLSTSDREGVIFKFDQGVVPCWGTYFGTVDDDNISDIQVVHDDVAGGFHLYIDGFTESSSYDQSFPCTTAVFTGGFPQCSTDGTVYSHASGAANIDAFIAKFDYNLALKWSTFIGGSGNDLPGIHSLAGYGNAVYMSVASVVAGGFPSFPTCTGCYNQQTAPTTNDGFIAEFGNGVLAWETFWGGDGSEQINSIYTRDLNLYIAGSSSAQNYASTTFCDVPTSGEYPLCSALDYYYQSTVNPNSTAPDIKDAFIAKFNSSNQLVWSSFIGGNKIDFATDITKISNALFLIGSTQSACINSSTEDFPQVEMPHPPAYYQLGNASSANCQNCHDGFVSKFDLSPPVGINELQKSIGLLNLYPNPTDGTITFSLNTSESGMYRLFDILGKLIISGKINKNGNSIILDLSDYLPGVYVLEVVCDKFAVSEKIIKQ